MEKKEYCVISSNFSPTAGLVYRQNFTNFIKHFFTNWKITPEIIENIETFPYPHNSSTASATVLV